MLQHGCAHDSKSVSRALPTVDKQVNTYGTRCINGGAKIVRYRDRQRFCSSATPSPRCSTTVTQADVKTCWLPHSHGPTQTSQLYKAGIYTGRGPWLAISNPPAVPPGQRASRIGKAKHSEYKAFGGPSTGERRGVPLGSPSKNRSFPAVVAAVRRYFTCLACQSPLRLRAVRT